MYTDYHAEAYFLQIPNETQTCVSGNRDTATANIEGKAEGLDAVCGAHRQANHAPHPVAA